MKYFGGKVFDGKGVAELSYISGRYPSLLRKSPLFVRDYDKCETIRHFNVLLEISAILSPF